MTREAQIKKAKRLYRKGLSYKKIGERLGVSTNVVWKWLNPASAREIERRSNERRAAAKRLHENSKRKKCQCGELMGAGSGYPGSPAKTCRKCQFKALNEQSSLRYKSIQRLWRRGWTLIEIADELDSTVKSVGTSMVRMRREGWDLPYRHRPK